MPIETTMRYLVISHKKEWKCQVLWGCSATKTFIYCWYYCKFIQPVLKMEALTTYHISYNPVTLLPDIYPKKYIHMCVKSHVQECS